MSSEYDPVLARRPPAAGGDDLDRVQEVFRDAARPYLRSPWSWLAWAVVLPLAAAMTPVAAAAGGPRFVLLLWSAAILAGGAVEAGLIFRTGTGGASTPLAAWVLRAQGNLSMVGLLLSLALGWLGEYWLLPGLWLLLLGHSLYSLGGLASPALRAGGVLYQLGGVAALWPGGSPLLAFGAATGLGNLWVAIALWRERRDREG